MEPGRNVSALFFVLICIENQLVRPFVKNKSKIIAQKLPTKPLFTLHLSII